MSDGASYQTGVSGAPVESLSPIVVSSEQEKQHVKKVAPFYRAVLLEIERRRHQLGCPMWKVDGTEWAPLAFDFWLWAASNWDRMRLTFLVAATAVVICGSAYGYCPQPTEPFCVDQRFTFEDEFRFRSCRGEMENYQAEVNG